MYIISHIIKPAALLILPATTVSATAQGVFKGRITDERQQPVAFANVMLLQPADSSFVEGTVSKEDGSFTLTPKTPASAGYLLKVSSTGYSTVYRLLQAPEDLGTIVLNTETIRLKGATVTAQRPTYSLEKGGITANVENSVLSRETSTNDVLRKLPGMMLKDGKVQTFTGDVPLIYINGKKATDYSLVRNLPVKEIKSVRLINNPGAEYDADTKCVLLITTRNRLEGLSAEADLEAARNHFNSHNEGINLSYTTGKMTIFANGTYDDSRMKILEHDVMTNTLPGKTYRSLLEATSHDIGKTGTYSLGFNYDINEKNHWGIEYSGSTNRDLEYGFMNDSTFINDQLYDHVTAPSTYSRDKGTTNHVNAFYTGTFSPKASFKFYADYLRSNTSDWQTVSEISTAEKPRTVETTNSTDYDIYAAKGIFGYTFNTAHSLNIGSEYSFSNGQTTLHYSDGSYPSDYSNKERKITGFAEYNFRRNRFSLNAGLRYEYVNSDLTNNLDGTLSLHRNYSNLLPSVSLNYATTRMVSHSLSLRTSVYRPDFKWLSGNSNYVNRYMRQLGNPELQPSTACTAQYTFLFKNFMFQASYHYVKDVINSTLKTDEQDPAVILATMKNFDHKQILQLAASYSYQWGIYQPSVTAALFKDFLRTEYLGKPLGNNKPIVQIDWNNGFNLPGGFFFNAEYLYMSGGSAQFMTLRPTHQLNLRLQKSFMRDNLTFTISGNDLLDKSHQRIRGGIGTVYLKQEQSYDSRSVSLHITYRFNSGKQKSYQGQSAAESEVKRLNNKEK